jgi:hypothetical protein
MHVRLINPSQFEALSGALLLREVAALDMPNQIINFIEAIVMSYTTIFLGRYG